MLNAGDNDDDIGNIWNAIMGGAGVNGAAADFGIDARLILCIIMQESNGNTGIGTPNDADGTAARSFSTSRL